MESLNKEKLISIRESLFLIAEKVKEVNGDYCQKLLDICDVIDNIFSRDEYRWPMSINNFCINFDLNRDTVHTHKRNYLKEGKDYFIKGGGRNKELYFEKSGALKIFEHCKSEKGIKYNNKHGVNINPKYERLFINIIEYAVSGFDVPKKQFKVKTNNKEYRIDLYLLKAKLAIECDENYHVSKEYSDRLREEEIISELGCRFIRFNPHDAHFNVGEVINIIFHYIFNKSINGKDPIIYYNENQQRSIKRIYNAAKLARQLTEEDLADFV